MYSTASSKSQMVDTWEARLRAKTTQCTKSLQTLVVAATINCIVSLIVAPMLHFVQLFLETVFVARQHIVTGMSLITYTVTELLYD